MLLTKKIAIKTFNFLTILVFLLMLSKPLSAQIKVGFAGVGSDVVGETTLGADGIPDWHIRFEGLMERPTRIIIENASGGRWENPQNPFGNWIIAIAPGTAPYSGDFAFKPYLNPEGFKVTFTFASGAIITAPVGMLFSYPENLQYQVVKSLLPDIDTLDNATRNGAVVKPWTKDIDSAQVFGLNPDTGYWFNTIVKDEAGNMAVYKMAGVKTLPDIPPTSNSPPTVVFTVPSANGFVVTAKTYTIKATATDDSGGLIEVGIYVEGRPCNVNMNTGSPTTISCPFNTSPYKGKIVHLTVSAKDNQGAISSLTWTVVVKK